MRTFNPEIYLTNGTRQVLGLTGQSTQPQSIVQAAQEGYFAATGRWPYVYGMPNQPDKGPEPEPEPEPEPDPTEIKFVSITVDGVLTNYGEPIYCKVNDALAVEAAITGDASPSYKWEARGNYPMVVSEQAAITTLTFPQQGSATVTLTVTDRTATDSPITYGMNFYIASQAEWDALHPAAAKPGIDLSGADDLMRLTIPQLKGFAATNGIDVAGLPRNKQLLAEYIAANMNLKDNA